jgi:chromosome segregation ATPase
VFAEPPVTPSTDAIDAIATEDISFDMDAIDNADENISFELKESDAEMTASEKMKMFAKQQIEENNSKLDSLNNEKDRAARELADAEADLAATKKNIDDCEAEISQLNIQLSEINAKLTDLQSKLSEYQINENKLLDNTVRSRAASQDLENSIAEILKENAEYEAFLN